MRKNHAGRRRYVALILGLLLCTRAVLAFPDLWYRRQDAVQGEAAVIEPAEQPEPEAALADYLKILTSPDAVWTSINLAYIDMEEILGGVRAAVASILRSHILAEWNMPPESFDYENEDTAEKVEETLKAALDDFMFSAYLAQGHVISGNLGEMFLSAKVYTGIFWMGGDAYQFVWQDDTESLIGLLFLNHGDDMQGEAWYVVHESILVSFLAQLRKAGISDDVFSWYLGGPGVVPASWHVTDVKWVVTLGENAVPYEVADSIAIPFGYSFGLLPAGLPEVYDDLWYVGWR